MPTPAIQRRWKNLHGEPVGDAGDPYTGYDRFGRTEQMSWGKTGESPVGPAGILPAVSSFTPLINVQWG